jgi:hypothetical protein
MTFQAVPECAEVAFDCIMNGAATANVLHFQVPGGYNQANLDALTTAVSAAYGAAFVPLWTLLKSYVGARGRGLALQNDVQSSSTAGAGSGTNTADQMPNNVSLCITFRTALTGRSARGRFYMQPPDLGNMSGANTVTSVYKDQVLAGIGSIFAAAEGQGWFPVVVSRFHNKVARGTGVFYPISAVVARNLRTDSQRGRMPAPD